MTRMYTEKCGLALFGHFEPRERPERRMCVASHSWVLRVHAPGRSRLRLAPARQVAPPLFIEEPQASVAEALASQDDRSQGQRLIGGIRPASEQPVVTKRGGAA
jgi:hypothetical protein